MCRSTPKRRCAPGARPRIWRRATASFESRLHIYGRHAIFSGRVPVQRENCLALLDDYTRRGNKSLQTLADGKETIWGLSALDKFFDYSEMPVVRLLKEPPPHKGFVVRAQFEHLLSKLRAHLRPLVTFLYIVAFALGKRLR
jgi:hypothetical protein